jgi:hypothetical protein
MNLSQTDIALFYKLWYELTWSINQKHGIVATFDKPAYGQRVDQQIFVSIRNELWKNPHWIDEFLSDNEYGELNEMECGMLSRWRKEFVSGRFLIMQHTDKYSVFMSADENETLYGVCGISDAFKDLVPTSALPLMVETVLLPFKDRIIYDSFVGVSNITFGRGMRSGFKESYNAAKKRLGIIEQIGVAPVVSLKQTAPSVPKAMAARYSEIAQVIEAYCLEKLNDGYKEVCLNVLAKLARKRPSPLLSGRTNTWACGIVYTVAAFNGTFGTLSPNYVVDSEMADWFGIAKRTASNKMNDIDELLGLSYSRMDVTVRE